MCIHPEIINILNELSNENLDNIMGNKTLVTRLNEKLCILQNEQIQQQIIYIKTREFDKEYIKKYKSQDILIKCLKDYIQYKIIQDAFDNY